MFGFFKKKPTPKERGEALFMKLRPFWKDVIEVVEHVEGPFSKLHEAGLFVGIVAMLELEKHPDQDVKTLAEEFALFWLVYVEGNPNDKECPSVQQLSVILGERYPAYQHWLGRIDQPQPDAKTSPEVQLAWELFKNCTGHQAPAEFLKLLPVARILSEVVVEITAEARAAAKG